MARKGNRQKNGLKLHLPRDKNADSDPVPSPVTTQQDSSDVNDNEVGLVEELPNDSHSMSSTKGTNSMDHVQDVKGSKKKSGKSQREEKKAMAETTTDHKVPYNDNTKVEKKDMSMAEASNLRDGSDLPQIPNLNNMNSFGKSSDSLHTDPLENTEFRETVVFKFIRTAAYSLARSSADWVERHKPTFLSLKLNTLKALDHVRMKIQNAQPIIVRWIIYIGRISLLLFMVWLDCALRGIDSFLRMGTTSFFSIFWCGVLSVIAMTGISKFLFTLAVAAAVGLFLGLIPAVVLTGIAGITFLWLYGSFWTTGLIIFLGGLAFVTIHDRIGLFITSAYSMYCAWKYVGSLGLVLGMNLSFISSDALLLFLRNIINKQRTPNSSSEQAAGVQGQPSFSTNESVHASPIDASATGIQADGNQGVPSTGRADSEMTSEDEVVRLLNCSDHYAALGLSRFENIDVSVIKREYRKKAMLVHPDKNMGNEKAAEAFMKLQNAYEVLLDSFKRKKYDDELRREELLNYFRKFQKTSCENQRSGFFKSGFAHPEANGWDPFGESRRIACRNCGSLHLWVYTKKTKSRARWCQECKDFHQAKDGDGWVEQFSKPFFFGILQQVEAPATYVCADGKIYDASEWYICQGMRCPANTHKPTFHVNTSIVSKNGHAKGTSSGQKGGVPAPNMEATMLEDEFFEWFQNAMQSGMLGNFAGSTSETHTGFNPKSGGSNSSKRKKKGKRQW